MDEQPRVSANHLLQPAVVGAELASHGGPAMFSRAMQMLGARVASDLGYGPSSRCVFQPTKKG